MNSAATALRDWARPPCQTLTVRYPQPSEMTACCRRPTTSCEPNTLPGHSGQREEMERRLELLTAVEGKQKQGKRRDAAPAISAGKSPSSGVRDFSPGRGNAALVEGSMPDFAGPPANSKTRNAADAAPYLTNGVFPTAGLALSGGGIRSAAFCTVMQALEQGGSFKIFDYLLHRRGGYVGSTVTLNAAKGNGFVLLRGGDEKKDADALKTVRNNANFLRLDNIAGVLKGSADYLRGLTVNIIIMAMLLSVWLHSRCCQTRHTGNSLNRIFLACHCQVGGRRWGQWQ